MRILIVENEPSDAELLSIIVKHAGYEPLMAQNGAEALSRVREGNIGLILMDWMMPVMDGLTATRKLKEDPATAEIPVIAVTAMRRASPMLEGGASAVLPKPFTRRSLLETLAPFLPLPPGPASCDKGD
ncbi:MAG: response regulator [Bacteroidota bacterium]